ncbi:hypothetical protein H696_01492 [Fonticula alba]|uniref:BRO1 domain-containing protein n=1 Tax=Fonticula alba TaxID=691883 RepID=A0A058ZCH7_FONAL|nr:hypothetical protein H696_01492 [Fonticula alba]KCV72084.1 hypothetical protein H696_01492 [Fonticula alba]|eukprot:XP_009493662.1 hypothetical protein H696_01492 [Fonticula alba]
MDTTTASIPSPSPGLMAGTMLNVPLKICPDLGDYSSILGTYIEEVYQQPRQDFAGALEELSRLRASASSVSSLDVRLPENTSTPSSGPGAGAGAGAQQILSSVFRKATAPSSPTSVAASSAHRQVGCERSLNALLKYYAQFEYFSLHFPMTNPAGSQSQEPGSPATHEAESDDPALVMPPLRIPFQWKDAFSGITASRKVAAFERSSILFNVGAILARMAFNAISNTSPSFNEAYRLYQFAAGSFHRLLTDFCDSPSFDMSHPMLFLLEKLMLAQSQECLLFRALNSGMKPKTLATVARGVVDLYSGPLAICQQLQPGNFPADIPYKILPADALPAAWHDTIRAKHAFYLMLTHYLSSVSFCGSYDTHHIEQMLGNGLHASELLKDLQESLKKKSSPPVNALSELLTFYAGPLATLSATLTKDNNLIYLARVPKPGELVPVESRIMAQAEWYIGSLGAEAAEQLAGTDLFEKLIPMAVHLRVSQFSHQLSGVYREAGDQLAALVGEFDRFVAAPVAHSADGLFEHLAKYRAMISSDGAPSEGTQSKIEAVRRDFAATGMTLQNRLEVTQSARTNALDLMAEIQHYITTDRLAHEAALARLEEVNSEMYAWFLHSNPQAEDGCPSPHQVTLQMPTTDEAFAQLQTQLAEYESHLATAAEQDRRIEQQFTQDCARDVAIMLQDAESDSEISKLIAGTSRMSLTPGAGGGSSSVGHLLDVDLGTASGSPPASEQSLHGLIGQIETLVNGLRLEIGELERDLRQLTERQQAEDVDEVEGQKLTSALLLNPGFEADIMDRALEPHRALAGEFTQRAKRLLGLGEPDSALSRLLAAYERLETQVREADAGAAGASAGTGAYSQRGLVDSRLSTHASLYLTLLQDIQYGTQFYQDLTRTLGQLARDTEQQAAARRAERDQRLEAVRAERDSKYESVLKSEVQQLAGGSGGAGGSAPPLPARPHGAPGATPYGAPGGPYGSSSSGPGGAYGGAAGAPGGAPSSGYGPSAGSGAGPGAPAPYGAPSGAGSAAPATPAAPAPYGSGPSSGAGPAPMAPAPYGSSSAMPYGSSSGAPYGGSSATPYGSSAAASSASGGGGGGGGGGGASAPYGAPASGTGATPYGAPAPGASGPYGAPAPGVSSSYGSAPASSTAPTAGSSPYGASSGSVAGPYGAPASGPGSSSSSSSGGGPYGSGAPAPGSSPSPYGAPAAYGAPAGGTSYDPPGSGAAPAAGGSSPYGGGAPSAAGGGPYGGGAPSTGGSAPYGASVPGSSSTGGAGGAPYGGGPGASSSGAPAPGGSPYGMPAPGGSPYGAPGAGSGTPYGGGPAPGGGAAPGASTTGGAAAPSNAPYGAAAPSGYGTPGPGPSGAGPGSGPSNAPYGGASAAGPSPYGPPSSSSSSSSSGGGSAPYGAPGSGTGGSGSGGGSAPYGAAPGSGGTPYGAPGSAGSPYGAPGSSNTGSSPYGPPGTGSSAGSGGAPYGAPGSSPYGAPAPDSSPYGVPASGASGGSGHGGHPYGTPSSSEAPEAGGPAPGSSPYGAPSAASGHAPGSTPYGGPGGSSSGSGGSASYGAPGGASPSPYGGTPAAGAGPGTGASPYGPPGGSAAGPSPYGPPSAAGPSPYGPPSAAGSTPYGSSAAGSTPYGAPAPDSPDSPEQPAYPGSGGYLGGESAHGPSSGGAPYGAPYGDPGYSYSPYGGPGGPGAGPGGYSPAYGGPPGGYSAPGGAPGGPGFAGYPPAGGPSYPGGAPYSSPYNPYGGPPGGPPYGGGPYGAPPPGGVPSFYGGPPPPGGPGYSYRPHY